MKQGGKAGYEAVRQMTMDFATGKPSIPHEALAKRTRPTSDRCIAAAERNNKPGKFTAFIGFEWTQTVKGNNLHRVVVFRDDRARQVLPFSEFDSATPEGPVEVRGRLREEDRRACAGHPAQCSAGLRGEGRWD